MEAFSIIVGVCNIISAVAACIGVHTLRKSVKIMQDNSTNLQGDNHQSGNRNHQRSETTTQTITGIGNRSTINKR